MALDEGMQIVQSVAGCSNVAFVELRGDVGAFLLDLV